MQWRIIFILIIFSVVATQCAQQKGLTGNSEDRIRQLRPDDITSYHAPTRLEIGWVPYQEAKLVMTKKGEWKVVKNDETDKQSVMPMILLTYPEGTDSLWLDMDIDNALLGRLLKHTLMTQLPISRPFTEYFEIAKCSKCHPKDIHLDFEPNG